MGQVQLVFLLALTRSPYSICDASLESAFTPLEELASDYFPLLYSDVGFGMALVVEHDSMSTIFRPSLGSLRPLLPLSHLPSPTLLLAIASNAFVRSSKGTSPATDPSIRTGDNNPNLQGAEIENRDCTMSKRKCFVDAGDDHQNLYDTDMLVYVSDTLETSPSLGIEGSLEHASWTSVTGSSR